MGILIVYKKHPFFQSIADLAVKPPHDYSFNGNYACIEVSEESLCFLTLTYKLSSFNHIPIVGNIPTYVIME